MDSRSNSHMHWIYPADSFGSTSPYLRAGLECEQPPAGGGKGDFSPAASNLHEYVQRDDQDSEACDEYQCVLPVLDR
ncbi:hypothetical protein GCM10010104_39100 [Streptomyces indiaensis]|uniref:Uncharacterized protein n=1 Tax=Streptomyces indiaensis TaxID=284033 RepID=A0ABP5QM97_9ACTN